MLDDNSDHQVLAKLQQPEWLIERDLNVCFDLRNFSNFSGVAPLRLFVPYIAENVEK